jgi:hypothetical protein
MPQDGPRSTTEARYGMKETELVELPPGRRRKAISDRKPKTANTATQLRSGRESAGNVQEP